MQIYKRNNILWKIIRKINSYYYNYMDYIYKKKSETYTVENNKKRIYLYHIRKTGGTSINYMFYALSGTKNENKFHEKLAQRKRILVNGLIYVGWNKYYLEQGKFFYGFSHHPQHQLQLPGDTFTITCIREPVSRIISHYKMLFTYVNNGIQHPDVEREGAWLGNGLSDFIKNVPKEHLLRQLYMFSRDYNIDEAYENIMRTDHCMLLDQFDHNVKELSKKLKLRLNLRHIKKSNVEIKIFDKEMRKLTEIMDAEIKLYQRIKRKLLW